MYLCLWKYNMFHKTCIQFVSLCFQKSLPILKRKKYIIYMEIGWFQELPIHIFNHIGLLTKLTTRNEKHYIFFSNWRSNDVEIESKKHATAWQFPMLFAFLTFTGILITCSLIEAATTFSTQGAKIAILTIWNYV